MHSRTEPHELVRQSAYLCNFSMVKFREFQERNVSSFSSLGSPAHDAAYFVARKYGPGEDWTAELIDRVSGRAYLYLAATEQHIAGLQTLLVHRPYTLALAPLVRSVIEGTARVVWLLDHTLALKDGSRRRVARLLLDEADEAHKTKFVMYEFGHPARARAGDDYRRRRDRIAGPGLFYASEIAVDTGGKVTLCGEQLPGPSETVRLAEKIMHPNGDRTISGVYSYLSSIAHPSVMSFLDSVDEYPSALAGQSEFRMRESPEFAAKLAAMAIRAFHEAWRLYSAWTGTSRDELDEVHEEHGKLHELISAFTGTGMPI